MIKKIAAATLAISALGYTISVSALTGIYVNGNLGYVSQNSANLNGMSRDRDHFGWNAFVGYNYDFTEKYGLAAELGYGDFGGTKLTDAAGTDLNIDQSAIMLLAVGNWHATPKITVFAKVGAAFGRTDVDPGDGLISTPPIADDTAYKRVPMFVFGAAYNITTALSAQVKWEHILGNRISDADFEKDSGSLKPAFPSVDSIMLGVTYTFAL